MKNGAPKNAVTTPIGVSAGSDKIRPGISATIKNAAPYIGHYHTAGVPGRHEIDESQELYYPAIIKAIEATGYDGFVAQEFIPTWDDQRTALADAIARCSG